MQSGSAGGYVFSAYTAASEQREAKKDEIPCGVWGGASSGLGRQPNVPLRVYAEKNDANIGNKWHGLCVIIMKANGKERETHDA